jgi:hypothetical protein
MRRTALNVALALTAVGAVAQPAGAAVAWNGGVELATDERRRGLSWSGGRAAASADLTAIAGIFEASARLVSTRSAARHAGADAVVDLGFGATLERGAVTFRPQAIGHVFADGNGALDYAELDAGAAATIGPVQMQAGIGYAPSQRAIGGDNLYLHADAQGGIPGTPLTLFAALGHSSGDIGNDGGDPARAARLRPGGDLLDWRLGVAYLRGRLMLGIDYTGTDAGSAPPRTALADPRHGGDRVAARARWSF